MQDFAKRFELAVALVVAHSIGFLGVLAVPVIGFDFENIVFLFIRLAEFVVHDLDLQESVLLEESLCLVFQEVLFLDHFEDFEPLFVVFFVFFLEFVVEFEGLLPEPNELLFHDLDLVVGLHLLFLVFALLL